MLLETIPGECVGFFWVKTQAGGQTVRKQTHSQSHSLLFISTRKINSTMGPFCFCCTVYNIFSGVFSHAESKPWASPVQCLKEIPLSECWSLCVRWWTFKLNNQNQSFPWKKIWSPDLTFLVWSVVFQVKDDMELKAAKSEFDFNVAAPMKTSVWADAAGKRPRSCDFLILFIKLWRN